MRTNIEKIQQKINADKVLESDTYYLLGMIGRMIEFRRLQNQYPAIWFYRNWISHSKIDRRSIFLDELRQKLRRISIDTGAATQIFGFLSFVKFTNELGSFVHQQIEPYLLLNDKYIKDVRQTLSQIVIDVPIILDIDDRKVELRFNNRGSLKIINLISQEITIYLIS